MWEPFSSARRALLPWCVLPSLCLAVATATAATSSAPSAAVAARPAGNHGNGFFVLNGRLRDPAGNEFRIRGVNRLHWDSDSGAGIARSGANTVRWGY